MEVQQNTFVFKISFISILVTGGMFLWVSLLFDFWRGCPEGREKTQKLRAKGDAGNRTNTKQI